MGHEEDFDSFYLATRRDLVHQTFALNGDLQVAQRAVRDAYVSAGHHWRKASAADDPTAWVRPRAWQLAQHRHTARLWARTRGVAAEQAAVLDAMARLSGSQRRTLVLLELAGVPLDEAARELNLSRAAAEQHLQAAIAKLAVSLDVDSTAVRGHLLSLAAACADVSLPRPTAIRREGRRRRRSHTLIAASVVTFLAVASGAFAHEPSRVEAIDTDLVTPPAGAALGAPDAVEPEPDLPTTSDLLGAPDLQPLGPGQTWRTTTTHHNTTGDGINVVCQQARFADPDGLAALVRESRTKSGGPGRTALQTVEISASTDQATAAYATTVGWYAGCPDGRLQVVSSHTVKGIGDQASLLLLRSWTGSATYAVGTARTGQVTTSMVVTTPQGAAPSSSRLARGLAASVRNLCPADDTDCVQRPRVRAAPPPPAGGEKGLLAVVDLPPTGTVRQPWVATEPVRAKGNPSATSCDQASFTGAGAERSRSRTFLIPGAQLPARFGITETYGTFPRARRAGRFLDDVRDRFARCEDRDLATQVVGRAGIGRPAGTVEGSFWRLETELSEDESVGYRVGLVRVGRTVAHLTFFPADRADLSEAQFRSLLVRAGDRLRELG